MNVYESDKCGCIKTENVQSDSVEIAVTAARILACEAITKAKSGHPGLPLGAAPAMYSIFSEMKIDPEHPDFTDRDRFVLSAGHGSALLYSMMHLFGYDMTIDDLKSFRQFESKTPGHPESRIAGVDASTGPLGHGIAYAVGMAMAESKLAAEFNTAGNTLFDHYTYCLCGEGCLMEGVGNEAVSLAGTLKLSKLILIYDKNNITIEGSKDLAFDEDVRHRFFAQNWDVLTVQDGNSVKDITEAIRIAKGQTSKPTLIIVNTTIGYGSPVAGTSKAHGSPLSAEMLEETKRFYNWNYSPFTVPEQAYVAPRAAVEKGKAAYINWEQSLKQYSTTNTRLYNKLIKFFEKPNINCAKKLAESLDPNKDYSTRASGSVVLNKLFSKARNMFGGSADLAPSNLTHIDGRSDYGPKDRAGVNIHFGIREHAMSCIANGIALHGGLVPFVSTFFVFSDFLKPGVRMSAIMNLKVIYILTHDSIGVGEDGETHQPVEQLAALRSIPNLTVFRPYDNYEVACAYEYAVNSDGPTAIVLSRQDIKRNLTITEGAKRGAYILRNGKDCVIIATGSEVATCLDAAELLQERGISARVVSMPSMELFEKQPMYYKSKVLPSRQKKRIAVEALSSFGWHKYVGLDGLVISVDNFGCSSKPQRLFEKFGLTAPQIADKVEEYCKSKSRAKRHPVE
ncbi:MAG: transketolase [Clostridia bacterium]|nr:transketolase [Clostridia bacterium]